MNRAGSVWFWSLLGAFIAAALGTAITLATGLISGVSQVIGRRDGDGSQTAGTTNVYNVQRPQVNVWLVFLILGVAGSLLAAIFVGVHFAGSIQTAGTPHPAAIEPRLTPPALVDNHHAPRPHHDFHHAPAGRERSYRRVRHRLLPSDAGHARGMAAHRAESPAPRPERLRSPLGQDQRGGRPSGVGHLCIDADTLIRAK
ncbi:serine/threonine protein kinase [Amycolatopsis sp. cmx-11-12]|uniref:serine/threonine protein kinase n=1 Tax=Amycolatopsis sp. cmx-11-12 TaxID=2785795 RepID=UPI003918210C